MEWRFCGSNVLCYHSTGETLKFGEEYIIKYYMVLVRCNILHQEWHVGGCRDFLCVHWKSNFCYVTMRFVECDSSRLWIESTVWMFLF